MPPHQGSNSRLLTAAEVALQQLSIAQPCPILQKRRPTKLLHNLAYLAGWHGVPSLLAILCLLPYYYRPKPI